MEKTNLYTSASIGKLLVKLCLPAIASMLVVTLYSMGDVFFIGMTGDTAQVAAVTLSGPIFSILSGIGTLLGGGGCAAVAIALGEKKEEKAKSISSFCCYASLVIGVVFTVVALMLMRNLLDLLNVSPETAKHARTYLVIVCAGAPAVLFSGAFANIVRAEGAIKEAMIGHAAGTILNIILDPLFILVFDMGIMGAALSTVIGNVVSMVYLCAFICGKRSRLSLSVKRLSFRKDVAWKTLALGVPSALSVIVMSVSGIVSNNVLGQFGDAAIAASGVAGKLSMIIVMVLMGLSMGIQPAIAYNHGAGNFARIGKIIKITSIVILISGAVMSVAGLLLRTQFLSAFLQDPAVMEYGKRLILAGVVTGPICGISSLCSSYLQATERIIPAMVNSLVRQGLYIPFILLLSAVFGFSGSIAAGIAADVLATAAGVMICVRQMRIMKKAQSEGLINTAELAMTV